MFVTVLHCENFLFCWLPEQCGGQTACQKSHEAGEEV
jgi:hypothetical protein